MLYALFTHIPVQTPWIRWPNFSGQLDDMFTNFIRPAVVGICIIVIAWMIIMTLVQQPDRTDIIWATLKGLGVALVGWFVYNLDDFVGNIVQEAVVLLPLLRTRPWSIWWSPPPDADPLSDAATTDVPDHPTRRS